METVFLENLSKASQNKKKRSFQILPPLCNRSNVPTNDDTQIKKNKL